MRQLAEQVGLVSATLLKYEWDLFPIPYPTAVAFPYIHKIDSRLLLDDFALFLDHPYIVRLQGVRKAYRLKQAEFAKKADISHSIYAKRESVAHQASRKMYE